MHESKRCPILGSLLAAAWLAAALVAGVLPAVAQQTPKRAKKADAPKAAPASRPAASAKPAADDESDAPKPFNLDEVEPDTLPFDRLKVREGKDTREYDCQPLGERPLPLATMRPSQKIRLRLLESGAEEYTVERRHVQEVIHFEDMLLKRADLFLERRQFNEAFEYLTAARRRHAQWPGLQDRLERLLFQEAEAARGQADALRALSLLAELAELHPKHAEVAAAYGRAAGELIEAAFGAADYRRGRWLLGQLSRRFPDHSVAKQWRERYSGAAQKLAAEAVAKEKAGELREACHLILHAAEIWPELPGLEESVGRIFKQHRVVVVGVQELAGEPNPWAAEGADRRVRRLVYQSVLDGSRMPEGETYASAGAESVQKADLGRRIQLRLRKDLRWSDGQGPVTTADLVYSLAERADPRSAGYDPVWARAFARGRAESLFDLTVEFVQPPLRPEALFQCPLVAHRGRPPEGSGPSAAPRSTVTGSGPFVASGSVRGPAAEGLPQRAPAETAYQVNRFYPAEERPKVNEIVERRYATSRDAVRDLVRGQLSLVEHVPPFEVEKARGWKGLTVGRYAVPRVHSLVFDFRQPALRNRSLRRSLAYAIDRQEILQEHLVGTATTEQDVLISAPLRAQSYAYAPLVQPWAYDPELAQALAAIAKKQLAGAVPMLRLHHPSDDVAREASRQIQRYLKHAGVAVELVETGDGALRSALATGQPLDLVYRITTTQEPIIEIERLLSVSAPHSGTWAEIGSPWLGQLLVRLEQATDWPDARATLQEIHRAVHDDVVVIPLWQLSDYFAHRSRLRGLEPSPTELYQGVENWQIDPEVVKDPFSSSGS